MRHNTIFVFLFSLTLLAFASVTKPVNGQEAPRILVQANAPGWVTVSWEHTGQDVYYFVIERQDSPYTDNSVFVIAQSQNRTDSVTDKNLQANTLYKYHVCAVYAYSRTCSDWVSVRTLSAPTSSSGTPSGSAPPPPVQPPVATPQIRATRDQDPSWLLLDWSGDPGWQEYAKWGNPPTPTYQHPQLKQVELYKDIAGNSKSSKPFYDALGWIVQSENGGGVVSLLSLRPSILRNTAYTFKVCFTTNDERKCSKEITASGKPVAPTAPVGVVLTQDQTLGVKAGWSNPDNFIPGQFITLEREDGVPRLPTMDSRGRVQTEQSQFKPTWIQIGKINDYPDPVEPHEITADAPPTGLQLRTEKGNNYRVCALVPELGAAGKVCSAAAILRPSIEGIRPVDPKRINKSVLTPKKP